MRVIPEHRSQHVSQRFAWSRIATSGLVLSGAGLLLSGCPGGADLADPEQRQGSLSEDGCGEAEAVAIFQGKCAGSICHGAEDGSPPSGGVDLIAPGVASRLLDQPAAYPGLEGMGCPEPPELLVDSVNLDGSLMLTKLDNTQACGDGMPIPHSASQLPDPEKQCIREWLQSVISGGGGDGDMTGTGGASAGTGGAGTGGDAAGTGGDAAGTGGDSGTGGAVSAGATIRIEAECSHGVGCTGGVMGANTGASQLENGDTTLGYVDGTVTLTFSNITAAGQDTITIYYAKANDGGTIEVHQDTAAGTLLATLSPVNTTAWDSWMELSGTLSAPLNGAATIVLVPVHDDYVANLDWIELSAGSAQ